VVDHSATPLPPAVCRLLPPAHTTPPPPSILVNTLGLSPSQISRLQSIHDKNASAFNTDL
jgi:hypothetical protein